MEANKIEFIHEKDVLIERYRLALERIKDHLIAQDYETSAMNMQLIATNALKEVK